MNILVSLLSIERIGGIFYTYSPLLFILTGIIGLRYLFKYKKIAKEFYLLLVLSFFMLISGINFGINFEIIIRSIQFLLIAITFIFLIYYLKLDNYMSIFTYVAYSCIVVFIIECLAKPDLLNALFSLNINYFLESGGTRFYNPYSLRSAGVQLIAQGNVFAAAIAGGCCIVLYFFGKKRLSLILGFLALLTGSRALFLSIFTCATGYMLWKTLPNLRKNLVIAICTILVLQPFLFLNIQNIASQEFNEFLYYLSPRYVAFIAYANMGMENLFGVGWFQGIEQVDYFFARWPIASHNIFLSVFGEIGILGYFVWSIFLFWVAVKYINNLFSLILFIFIFTMYSFIGGFNEWGFWIPFALVIHLGMSKKTTKEYNLDT